MLNINSKFPGTRKAGENSKFKNGVSVLFVVFIMTILLAIGLGISGILVQQTKMMREIGHSVVSFFAADSGIEEHLYRLYKSPPSPPIQPLFSGNCDNATFQVLTKCGLKNATSCPSGFEIDYTRDVYYWTKSIGNYQETRRAIEINY